jgi:hypothetical protein
VSDNSERWIVITNWEGFQHPDAGRSSTPPWIKDSTAQLSKDEYLGLSFHLRGVLEGLRLEYARAHRQLRDSTLSLTRRLGQRVSTRDLESLNHAGFIEFSASNPASKVASILASPEQSRKERALAKGLSGQVDMPQDQEEGEGDSAYALVLLLAAVEGSDAVKAQLRSKVEAMALQPYALHSARDELVKAKSNGKHIRSEKAYVLAICERYAEPDLEEPEPSLKPKAAA